MQRSPATDLAVSVCRCQLSGSFNELAEATATEPQQDDLDGLSLPSSVSYDLCSQERRPVARMQHSLETGSTISAPAP